MQLGLTATAPIVDLGAASDPKAAIVWRTKQGLAKSSLARTERHGFKAFAIISSHDRADMIGADNVGLDDAHWPGGDARRWPAHAVGATGLKCLNQCWCYAARGDDYVKQERAIFACARHISREPIIKEIGERINLICHYRKASRHCVAAACDQQPRILGGQHCRTQINPGD